MKFEERISIAPMMDCTDKHFRYLMRLISRHTVLYSEMVHTNQILFADKTKFLSFNPEESPVVLQLGGSDPQSLAKCAKQAEYYGYDAINLNVGCPSERVQKGQFGACLMKEAELVADCIAAMREAVSLPVTVKTRLGVDEYDSEQFLCQFIETVAASGCEQFILHARKAWLKGLNPKQNRSIPPLNYERVYKIKKLYPRLHIGINGGITTLREIQTHLQYVDSVMIGREAYQNAWLFSEIDKMLFSNETAIPDKLSVIQAYLTYAKQQFTAGVKLNFVVRPLLGLFKGLPGAKQIRHYLMEAGRQSTKSSFSFDALLVKLDNAL